MSAPNVNKPNEGIVGQIGNSLKNAGNYVAETVQGKTAEVSKEQNKEQAKGNVPGKDTLSDRASGAFGAVSDKLDQAQHDASAKANKEGI
ncbi:Ras- protein rsr1 [Arthrobotrys musiformis]|uniref:Ras- protein rsr1 n=1 Tax=Arthrobotrys musiformis TaxID=47236 RepID=A0AAV9WSI4_9PEZI